MVTVNICSFQLTLACYTSAKWLHSISVYVLNRTLTICTVCNMLAGSIFATTGVTVRRHSEWRPNFTTNNSSTSTSACPALQVRNHIIALAASGHLDSAETHRESVHDIRWTTPQLRPSIWSQKRREMSDERPDTIGCDAKQHAFHDSFLLYI